jgi:hypothetical protein
MTGKSIAKQHHATFENIRQKDEGGNESPLNNSIFPMKREAFYP